MGALFVGIEPALNARNHQCLVMTGLTGHLGWGSGHQPKEMFFTAGRNLIEMHIKPGRGNLILVSR